MASYYVLNAHLCVLSLIIIIFFFIYKDSTFSIWPVAGDLKSTCYSSSTACSFSDNKLAPKRTGENHKFSLSVT